MLYCIPIVTNASVASILDLSFFQVHRYLGLKPINIKYPINRVRVRFTTRFYMSHPRLQMVETTATNEMPVLHKNNLRVATPLENHTEEHIFINTRLLRIVV